MDKITELVSKYNLKRGKELLEQAQNLGDTGRDADRFLRGAVKCFTKAMASPETKATAVYHWGLALYNQARHKPAKESEPLLDKVLEKYQEAVELDPKNIDAINDTGVALMALARTRGVPSEDELYTRAERQFTDAESAAPGVAAYNMACLYALRGNPAACQECLDKARSCNRLPTAEFLLSDPDLDSVRDEQWFSEMVSTL